MDRHTHSSSSLGSMIVKITLVVMVGAAIFGVGVCAGIQAAFMRKVGIFNPTMMGSATSAVSSRVNMMDQVVREGEKEWFNRESRSVRLFGTITKVEANQITILDNAAKNDMIVTLSTTIITSSSTEVGLAALKVGQNIVALGTVNPNNVLEAKMIQIQ